jgi:hypothetical protein
MDKKKNKKEAEIEFIDKYLQKKLGGKSYYIKMSKCYIDSNNNGDVFLSEDKKERNLYQKWEFTTESPGTYYLKNLQTSLYLTTDDSGSLYTTTFIGNEFQRWTVYSDQITAIRNNTNKFVICKNSTNRLFMIDKQNIELKDLILEILASKIVKK